MSFRRVQKDKSEQKEKGNVHYKVSKGQVRAKREGKWSLEGNKRTSQSEKRRRVSFRKVSKRQVKAKKEGKCPL